MQAPSLLLHIADPGVWQVLGGDNHDGLVLDGSVEAFFDVGGSKYVGHAPAMATLGTRSYFAAAGDAGAVYAGERLGTETKVFIAWDLHPLKWLP